MSDTTPQGAGPGAPGGTDLDEALAVTPVPSDPDDLEELEEQEAAEEGTEIDIEAPEADAQEQQQELLPHRDDPGMGHAGYDANPADATEQHRVVELDEDDYR